MSIYDDLRAVASDVMKDFAQDEIRYVTVTAAAGARADKRATPVRTPSNPLNAVARPVSTKYVDGTTIVRSDKMVTLVNNGETPTPDMKDMVRINGVDHKILEIMATPAAGDPISWKVIVRKQ